MRGSTRRSPRVGWSDRRRSVLALDGIRAARAAGGPCSSCWKPASRRAARWGPWSGGRTATLGFLKPTAASTGVVAMDGAAPRPGSQARPGTRPIGRARSAASCSRVLERALHRSAATGEHRTVLALGRRALRGPLGCGVHDDRLPRPKPRRFRRPLRRRELRRWAGSDGRRARAPGRRRSDPDRGARRDARLDRGPRDARRGRQHRRLAAAGFACVPTPGSRTLRSRSPPRRFATSSPSSSRSRSSVSSCHTASRC